MKKHNCLSENHKLIFESIIQEKQEPRKTALSSIKQQIFVQYNAYDQVQEANQLLDIKPLASSITEKDYLIHCYNSKTKTAKDYLKRSIDHLKTIMLGRCPYCEYYQIDNIDHYLPSSVFSEYSIFGKNLIPSCPKCNSTKNKYWEEDGDRLFIHAFIDDIPIDQFIFCDIEVFRDNTFKATFRLSFEKSISISIKQLIETHFEKLHLLSIYKENSNSFFSELKETIESFQKTDSINSLKESLNEQLLKYNQRYGNNHWRSAALIALINNEAALSILMSA